MRISDWSSDVCSSDLLLSPNGLDGPSPSTSAPTSVASPTAVAFAAGRSATNTRVMRPSLPVYQWRMNMWSETKPVYLHLYASPSFRSEDHTSELPSLMRISYAEYCLKKKQNSAGTIT